MPVVRETVFGWKRCVPLAAVIAAVMSAGGCGGSSNVSYGVGYHTGTYGWGSSFSVGITNHHYRGHPRYRYRGP